MLPCLDSGSLCLILIASCVDLRVFLGFSEIATSPVAAIPRHAQVVRVPFPIGKAFN